MSTIYAASALLPEGWASDVRITIETGAIAAVDPGVPERTPDERHAIALPALANLHSHAFQRAMAGLAEVRGPSADTFWSWRETMYRFAPSMTPDEVEAVAAEAYVEMLEAGFAAVAEFHYLHNTPDGSRYAAPAEMAFRVLAAARDVGIAVTLLPVFYAHADFGPAPPRGEQRRFITDLPAYARLVDDCRRAAEEGDDDQVGVAPHSLRAVTADELEEVVALSGDGPIHIHAAEQAKEVEDCIAALGARPVRWLLDHAGVDRCWCLVHATHMVRSETRDLARSRAVVGLCPVTEANLGDGVFHAPAYVEAGGRFGIGTDSNVSIDAASELRQLEYSQRLDARARNVLAPLGRSSGRTLLDAALIGGAQALARPSGRLAAGTVADILTLNADHPMLAGKAGDQILDAWIFSAGNALVNCVFVGGRQVVDGGRHVARDRVAARFKATMLKLVVRAAPGALPPRASGK